MGDIYPIHYENGYHKFPTTSFDMKISSTREIKPIIIVLKKENMQKKD